MPLLARRALAPFALALSLTLPFAAAAQEPVADITLAYVVPYLPDDLSARNQTAQITAGVDGAPEVIEMGMIFRVIDKDDPSKTAIAEVTGHVGDGQTTSTTKFIITFISKG